jgi:hypothetical protein
MESGGGTLRHISGGSNRILDLYQVYSLKLLTNSSTNLNNRYFYFSKESIVNFSKKVSINSFNRMGGLKVSSTNGIYSDLLISKYSGLKSFIRVSNNVLNNQIFYSK